MLSSSVLVFVTTGTAAQSRAGLLRSYFSSPIFQVMELGLKDVKDGRRGLDDQHSLLKEALYRAAKIDKKAPVVVISDRMLPNNANAGLVSEMITRALKVKHMDMVYLGRHLDACQLLSRVEVDLSEANQGAAAGKPLLLRTLGPQGLEALLFTPHGRDIVLGRRTMANNHKLMVTRSLEETLKEEIYHSNISALCVSPCLFRFDIHANATRNMDYLKANECVAFDLMAAPGKKLSAGHEVDDSSCRDNGRGFRLPGGVLFVFVTLVVLIVAWCFYSIWPGKTGGGESASEDNPKPPVAPKRTPYGGGNNPMVANHNGGDTSLWQSDF